MKRALSNYKKIGIDTNIFIYYLNQGSPYYLHAVALFTVFIKKQAILITSTLTLTEILSLKTTTEPLLSMIEEAIVSMPNLQLISADRIIAKRAAQIRRMYNFALTDSVQLATALENNAEVFITNDKKLQRFKKLPVILLTSLSLQNKQ
ncbi:MAG: PIN domain-containing protein [Candidatus Levybacteria bacterium]|nr:PIN domain-containing protein [Candidatus Levybacteria bacterium]